MELLELNPRGDDTMFNQHHFSSPASKKLRDKE
jgi:hypothetical protein